VSAIAASNDGMKLCLQETIVNDLKQQLANSERARTMAENQLMELRMMQKAVGQPTEVCSQIALLSLAA
jgi:hypothetical protein